MKIKFKWKEISPNTHRAKVMGGWIVKQAFWGEDECAVSMVFIPDPNHEWEIEDEPS